MEDNEKKVSLTDLAEGAKQTASMPTRFPTRFKANQVREVADYHEVVQPKASEKPVEGVGMKVIDDTIKAIPETIERLRQESLALIEKGQEERIEAELDSDNVDAGSGFISEEEIEKNQKAIQQKTNRREEYFPEEKKDDDVDFGEEDDDDDVDFPEEYSTPVRPNVPKQENVPTPTMDPAEDVEFDPARFDKMERKVTKIMSVPEFTEKETEQLAETVAKTYEAVTGDTVEADVKVKAATPAEEEVKVEEKIEITDGANRTVTMNLLDDDDLSILDDDEEAQKTAEQRRKEENDKLEEIRTNVKKDIEQVFKPVSKPININNFKIKKKAISASKVLNKIQNAAVNTATNVLYATGEVAEVSELNSLEIQKLDPGRVNNNSYYTYMRDIYQILFNHIVDANKPEKFETWTKTTPFEIIDDLFFAAYKATFGDANILTFTCPNCQNVFLKEFPIHDMIKFKDDTVKDKYYKLLRTGPVHASTDSYTAGMYQMSDTYVATLKHPMLYDQIIVPTFLNEEFSDKYGDLLTLCSYIDEVYVIDHQNEELIPVDMKPDPTNPANTIKRKIKTCSAILKTLTSDQLQALSTETDKYDQIDSDRIAGKKQDEDAIKYIYPACTCPKCNAKINEQEELPQRMLFTRHQLGAYQRV